MAYPLTEKTLELNVMAELAYLGRRAGYRPYFLGFSQLSELYHGTDTFFSAGSVIGFFQFKRGVRRSKFFTFYINNNPPHFNQHARFCNFNKVTSACRYMLPLIGSNKDVYRFRGSLLKWTAQLRPEVLNPLSPSNRPHRVRLYYNGKWIRFSDVKEGDWRNVFGDLPDETDYERIDNKESEEVSSERVFRELELPKLGATLKKLKKVRKEKIKRVLQERSAFCMIFDK